MKPKRTLWSPEDDAILRRMYAEGASYAEIAKQIPGRNESAVRHRRDHLGIPPARRKEMSSTLPGPTPTKPKGITRKQITWARANLHSADPSARAEARMIAAMAADPVILVRTV